MSANHDHAQGSKITTLEEFYSQIGETDNRLLLSSQKGQGHFNVFDIASLQSNGSEKGKMPYDRRAYYKISLIIGKNRAEYADRVFQITESALLFATPKIPYHWIPQEGQQQGYFCIFTDEFIQEGPIGIPIDELPLFQAGGYPLFSVSHGDAMEIEVIFKKMQLELSGDYQYKYDLLRGYLLELIHTGQKLQPFSAHHNPRNAASRVSSLFLELLERQFPITSSRQPIQLKSAGDYARRLSVHVNHLNKVLKESLGKTTTELILARIARESRILLKQTDWSISEIAYCLGFDQVAHFSNFFKKHTGIAPLKYRTRV